MILKQLLDFLIVCPLWCTFFSLFLQLSYCCQNQHHRIKEFFISAVSIHFCASIVDALSGNRRFVSQSTFKTLAFGNSYNVVFPLAQRATKKKVDLVQTK
jgi:hypothetical protein